MAQGRYETMASQISNRLNINFLVFSLSLGDFMAYKLLNCFRTTVCKQLINCN